MLLDLLFVCMVGESLVSANIVITKPVYPDTASSGHLEMKVMCYLIYSHRLHTVSTYRYHSATRVLVVYYNMRRTRTPLTRSTKFR